jgi:hypothetical protein
VRAHRLFIIAPSLARLIRQERGGEHVREGYFPDQPDRSTYVQIEGCCHVNPNMVARRVDRPA